MWIKIVVFIFSFCCLSFAFFFRDLILQGLISFVLGTVGVIYLLKKLFE